MREAGITGFGLFCLSRDTGLWGLWERVDDSFFLTFTVVWTSIEQVHASPLFMR